AQLIQAAPSDIAFIPNASTGLSLFLGGIDWQQGDRIVTLEEEFPNQVYYAQHLRARGVELVEVPMERLAEAITPRTRAVTVSTVNYSTGYRPPLEEVSAAARASGALLYVDGTQSLGALAFDVRVVRPSMLSVDAYKWMNSPNGAGFMYVEPGLRESLQPSVIGWRSHCGWRNPENLHHGAPEFSKSAEKYEGGMVPFPSLYAMGESVRMMLEIGPGLIEQRVMQLAGLVRNALQRSGGVVGRCDSPIVTAKFADADAVEIAAALKRERILVAARKGNLRVSPHFYNNEDDVAKLELGLRKIL
ncbi:MAG: aminotransferase class V-fold PLP-dependent enzyme, partial [Bryobacteraceae bacterium]